MKRLVFLGAFLLGACPKPLPPPVTPIEPAAATCDTDSQLHDMVVNDSVNALVDGVRLDAVVQRFTLPVVRCAVQEIADDVESAPGLVARAQAWLAMNGGNQ